MAFVVRRSPADLDATFEKATGYDTDETIRGLGGLHSDGGLADLQALRLRSNGDAEAERFADATPGDELNLSSEEIAAFRALPGKSKAAVKAGRPLR